MVETVIIAATDTDTLLFGLAVLAFVFWLVELVSLMRLSDAAFPGRYDKPLWVAILLLTFVVGALLFWIWKMGRRREQEADQVASAVADMIRKNQKPGETEPK